MFVSNANDAAPFVSWSRKGPRVWDRCTQAGCNAICPTYNRGCYGCFGPAAQPNLVSITHQFADDGMADEQMVGASVASTVTRPSSASKAIALRRREETNR